MTEAGVTAVPDGMVTSRVVAESLKVASLPSVHTWPSTPSTIQLASVPFQFPLADPFQNVPVVELRRSSASDPERSVSPAAGAHGTQSPATWKSVFSAADQKIVPETVSYRPARPLLSHGR